MKCEVEVEVEVEKWKKEVQRGTPMAMAHAGAKKKYRAAMSEHYIGKIIL